MKFDTVQKIELKFFKSFWCNTIDLKDVFRLARRGKLSAIEIAEARVQTKYFRHWNCCGVHTNGIHNLPGECLTWMNIVMSVAFKVLSNSASIQTWPSLQQQWPWKDFNRRPLQTESTSALSKRLLRWAYRNILIAVWFRIFSQLFQCFQNPFRIENVVIETTQLQLSR